LRKKPRRFYFRLSKNKKLPKTFLVYTSWKKPRRFYFRLTKKIRSSQKPSWFDIHCGEKTKKVLFQTFKK
jgi:hypothetical protein